MMANDEIVWAVEGVDKENLSDIWMECWPWLRRSIERFPHVANPYTENGLLTELLLEKKQLWLAWNFHDEKVSGAAITEILTDLDRRNSEVLCVAIVGGEQFNEWGFSLWQLAKDWGAAHKCKVAIYRGRKGWSRMFGFSFVTKDADGIPLYYRRIMKG